MQTEVKKLLLVLFFFQAQRVRDAAFGCDWVGAPISFQKSLSLMIACTNKEIILTAGKCVPVSKETMVNVSAVILIKLPFITFDMKLNDAVIFLKRSIIQ
ncbi:hypothetical protein ANN_17295, partial [Periplaneta americana]